MISPRAFVIIKDSPSPLGRASPTGGDARGSRRSDLEAKSSVWGDACRGQAVPVGSTRPLGGNTMAIGPVQLIVLGFNHPDFHGEVIAELERLHENGMVRVIDSIAVYKDADGELEMEHLSNLTQDEAIELGSKIGALIGLGIDG